MTGPPVPGPSSRRQVWLAWAVHGVTASGLVLAAGAALFIVHGGDPALRFALVCLWVAGVVDCTDGWMARKARVAETLPGFDGRRLDDLVDFHTYVSLPLLLLWRAGIPGSGLEWVLLIPLLAGAYGFSQTAAKTEDGYFLGFPSYWNVVAFYLFALHLPAWGSVPVLVGFAILTFVPIPYLYPSRGGPWSRTFTVLGAAWAILVLGLLLGVTPGSERGAGAEFDRAWVWVSLGVPLFYLTTSWAVAVGRWRRRAEA